jgi:hypothetical protein
VFPNGISQCRIYESGIDEDRLGTFRLRAGSESPATVWYGTFWRRYWYESFTGAHSNVPAPEGPAPDAEGALNLIAVLLPKLDSLCERAEDIVRAACRKPIAAQMLKALQQEQTREREAAVHLGMNGLATAPLTTEFVRAVHNDNMLGVEHLARHHARAYRRWRLQLAEIRPLLEAGRGSPAKRVQMISGSLPACAG